MSTPVSQELATRLGAVRLGALASRGHVIAIDARSHLGLLEAATVRELGPPESDALTLPDEPWDAALIGGLGRASPLGLVRALAPRVRVGGSITFLLPTARPGLKGVAGSLLGVLRRKKPMLLEELCEALLLAGLRDVEARELEGATGTSIVSATVR